MVRPPGRQQLTCGGIGHDSMDHGLECGAYLNSMVHVFAFAGFATTAPKEMADQVPPVFRTKMLRWSLGGDPQAMPASRLRGFGLKIVWYRRVAQAPKKVVFCTASVSRSATTTDCCIVLFRSGPLSVLFAYRAVLTSRISRVRLWAEYVLFISSPR